MDAFLIIIGLACALSGIAGSILPIIPGPSLSFFSLIIISFARDWTPFSAAFLAIAFGLTLLISLLDYVIPALGAKKYGASKPGIWCSVIGMVAGLIFFPPFGIFVGAFLGAVMGEFLAGKDSLAALKAGWGILVGNLLAITLKLTFSGAVLYFYIREIL